MLNSLLDIVPGTGDGNPSNYYFNNAGEPFIYALIGFLIVFLGIVIIITIIWLIGLLMRKTNNLEFLFKKDNKKKPEPVKEETNEVSATDGEVPDEIKVAIMAALMAYYSEEKPECEFKVKRIKRI